MNRPPTFRQPNLPVQQSTLLEKNAKSSWFEAFPDAHLEFFVPRVHGSRFSVQITSSNARDGWRVTSIVEMMMGRRVVCARKAEWITLASGIICRRDDSIEKMALESQRAPLNKNHSAIISRKVTPVRTEPILSSVLRIKFNGDSLTGEIFVGSGRACR